MTNAENPHDLCQLSSWLRQFQGHTIRSVILPLPAEFVTYLAEDGLTFADGCGAVSYTDGCLFVCEPKLQGRSLVYAWQLTVLACLRHQ